MVQRWMGAPRYPNQLRTLRCKSIFPSIYSRLPSVSPSPSFSPLFLPLPFPLFINSLKAFHIYSIEYNPGGVSRFYIDRALYYTFNNSPKNALSIPLPLILSLFLSSLFIFILSCSSFFLFCIFFSLIITSHDCIVLRRGELVWSLHWYWWPSHRLPPVC